VLSTLVSAAPVFVYPGWGFGFFFVLGHIFGVLLLIFLIMAIVRGTRRGGWSRGPYGHHGWSGHPGYWAQASRSAESTLADRYANGDIDEKEYRARLEVIRANAFPPAPPAPPKSKA
jgi:putative membrane protein